MSEPRKRSVLRQALFDRPILKLFGVVLFILITSTLAPHTTVLLLRRLMALAAALAAVYAIVLTGHIFGHYLIRRLLTARDIFSLLVSYVMLIAGILLVISSLFGAVQDLNLGYLTHGPTSDKFNSDVIASGDPNISHDYLYFTAVTFFSVGYGDICPMGLSKPLAILTAFTGNVVTVVLMAIVVSAYLNRRSSDQASRAQPERKADS
jgi:potassium channel LctB